MSLSTCMFFPNELHICSMLFKNKFVSSHALMAIESVDSYHIQDFCC